LHPTTRPVKPITTIRIARIFATFALPLAERYATLLAVPRQYPALPRHYGYNSAVAEKTEAPKLWRDRVPLDWLAKALALTAAVFYGVLFIAYRLYYSEIGLRPEDGGVDNAFLAPRAIGLGLTCVITAACLGLLIYYYTEPESLFRLPPVLSFAMKQIIGFIAGVLCYYVVKFNLPETSKTLRTVLALFLILACLAVSIWLKNKTQDEEPARARAVTARFAGILATFVAIVFPIAALWVRSYDLGTTAHQGVAVSPIEIFRVPLLDVRARPVALTWISATKWPAEPFGAGEKPIPVSVLLLARDSTTVSVLHETPNGRRVIRLNTASISMDYEAGV
jgi:heme/copper-type cytochrome/quinol oxidase subunit 4